MTGATIAFGGVAALRGVDLALREGVSYGVIGPNGSGKTTLLNCLTGYVRPDGGSIVFRGRSIVGLPPHRVARLGIGRTFQTPTLFEDMTIDENVAFACDLHRGGSIVRRLVTRPNADTFLRTEALLDRLGILGFRHRHPDSIPVGVAKLAAIASALAREPDVLLLDEPAAGLNDAERDQLLSVLAELHRVGLTIVLIDHNISFVTAVCTELVVLAEGEVISRGEPSEVRKDKLVISAYLGTLQ